MFLCICNTFIGSNLNYKKVSCTLKIGGGGGCHFENMLINQFPGSNFGKLFFRGLVQPNDTPKTKKLYYHRKLHQGTQSLHNHYSHPHNVNSKLAFDKVASFHQHYSTYTLQTYHHQEHQFRSWPTQMTSSSHLHTQARVQQRNTYNHTYIKFLPGQNKTISH